MNELTRKCKLRIICPRQGRSVDLGGLEAGSEDSGEEAGILGHWAPCRAERFVETRQGPGFEVGKAGDTVG